MLESQGGSTYLTEDSNDSNEPYRTDEGEEYADWSGYDNSSFDNNQDRYRSYDRGYQSTSFNPPSRPKKQTPAPSNKAAVYEGRKQSTFGANPSPSSKKSLKLSSKRQASSTMPASQHNVKQEPLLNVSGGTSDQKVTISLSQNESPYDYPTKAPYKQETPYAYPNTAESKPSYNLNSQPASQSFGGFTSAGSLPMDQPFKPTKGSKRKGIKREYQQATETVTASASKKTKGKGKVVKVGNRLIAVAMAVMSGEDH